LRGYTYISTATVLQWSISSSLISKITLTADVGPKYRFPPLMCEEFGSSGKTVVLSYRHRHRR
jgi:hypothetical protein